MQQTAKIVVVSQHYPPDHSTTAAIMASIAGHLASEAPLLVLSGMPGSANQETIGSGRPAVIEIRNQMGAKAALVRRATAEMFFTTRVFVALLRRCDPAMSCSR
jgi:colanic acid biosynthesis glycosyl transferase WcaI